MIKTKQVFISHATEDAQFAHRLADDLQRLGVQVWIAPEGIRPGEGWVSAIERGLNESSHAVIVLTPAALQSKWVKKETDVTIAQERKGRIQVIPLYVEPCEVPLLLSSYQMVPFHGDYDAGLSQLANILGLRVAEPPEEIRKLEEEERQKPAKGVVELLRKVVAQPGISRYVIGTGVVVALAVVAVFAVLTFLPGLQPTPTGIAEATPTSRATEAIVVAPTNTPTPSRTSRPTNTPLATHTSPPELPTATPKPSDTPVPMSTSTPQPTPTPPGSATATAFGTTAASPTTRPSTPTSTPTATVPSQSVYVPDAVVSEFFSPGPSPAALAVAGDTIWVVNDQPRMLYQLDRAGVPLASFPITPTGTIHGLAWDGQVLHLASGRQVVRLDTDGTVLTSFSLPDAMTYTPSLGWNPDCSMLWTHSNDFLLEFSADGRLLQTLHAPIFGYMEGLAWAPDGLWVVTDTGYWYRFGFGGEELRGAPLTVLSGIFSNVALTWDERGYLWVTIQNLRQIYQFSLRQDEVQLTSTATTQEGGKLAMPRSQLKPSSIVDKVIVHMTNNLEGIMTLSFDDESAIVEHGNTWSAELPVGVYEVFISANIPEPIAFSDKVLLMSGYEWTWVLNRPE
ncbi:MAG: TIR domain-containing protein [Anaerolineae bacterium]|nr:TIR domain-containing protein [Anaerolineae bacterium]